MNRKFALVLSGGGFKGAFQVGALDYLLHNELMIDGQSQRLTKFSVVSGVSVGSLNGAMIATDQFELLKELWLDKIAVDGPGIIYRSQFFEDGKLNTDNILKYLIPDLNVFEQLGVLFSKKRRKQLIEEVFEKIMKRQGLADNKPLLETLLQYVSLSKIPADTIFKMGYVSLNDGLYKSDRATDFGSDLELNKAILASTTMPVIWPPVDVIENKYGKRAYNGVDGGIRNVTPLKDVIDEINDDSHDTDYHIIVINCNPAQLAEKSGDYNILSIASRSLLEITLSEIFQNDIDQFIFINEILKSLDLDRVEVHGKEYKRFKIKIIQPVESLGDVLDSDGDVLRKRYDIGYNTARSAFDRESWI